MRAAFADRGIRLELPSLFRAPYYFILTLFFVYPVALTPLVDRPQSEGLSWALFGFSPAAALVFLTLLPAIRHGRDCTRWLVIVAAGGTNVGSGP